MTTETTGGAAAVKTEVVTPAVSADDFDAAFNAAIAGLEPEAKKTEAVPATEPVKTEPIKTEAAPVVEPAKTEPVKTEPAKTEAVPATEPVKTEPIKTEAAPVVEPAKTAPAPDPRQLAEEAARRVAEETAARQTAEKTAREQAEAREIKDPVLTEEQNQVIASFEKEWPDVAAAMKIRNEHQIASLETRFARALTSIVGKLYEDIAPLATSIANVEGNSFREQVLKAHADYDTIYPQLEGWIAKQPAYLTEAFKRVYNEGNVQEVSDLVNRFKEANGTQPKPQGSPTPASPIPAVPTKEQVAAKTKAGELAPVSGQRTAPNPLVEDANDFEGAFLQALAANK
jgi:outer membrane biosynthesis protein TonB